MAGYYFSNPAFGAGLSNLAEAIAGDPLQDVRAGLLGAQRLEAERMAERAGFENQGTQQLAELFRTGQITPETAGQYYAAGTLAGGTRFSALPNVLLGYGAASGAGDDYTTQLQTGAGMAYGNTIAGSREGWENDITRAHIAAGPGYAAVAEDRRQFDAWPENIRVIGEDGVERVIAVPRSDVTSYEGQGGLANNWNPNDVGSSTAATPSFWLVPDGRGGYSTRVMTAVEARSVPGAMPAGDVPGQAVATELGIGDEPEQASVYYDLSAGDIWTGTPSQATVAMTEGRVLVPLDQYDTEQRARLSGLTPWNTPNWYYNPTTGDTLQAAPGEEVPEGFLPLADVPSSVLEQQYLNPEAPELVTYYNPNTEETIQLAPTEEAPLGFVPLSQVPADVLNQDWGDPDASAIGFYYNPTTNQVIQAAENEIVPDGYVPLGDVPASVREQAWGTPPAPGQAYFYNPITREIHRFPEDQPPPQGYIPLDQVPGSVLERDLGITSTAEEPQEYFTTGPNGETISVWATPTEAAAQGFSEPANASRLAELNPPPERTYSTELEGEIRRQITTLLGDEGLASAGPNAINRIQDIATRLYVNDENQTIAGAVDLANRLARISAANDNIPVAVAPGEELQFPPGSRFVDPRGRVLQIPGGQ